MEQSRRFMRSASRYLSRRNVVVVALTFGFVMLTISYSSGQLDWQMRAYADGKHLLSIYADGKKKMVATSATTVGEAIEELGLPLEQGDVIEPGPDTPIDQPTFNINIYRGLPAVVEADGKSTTVITGHRSPRQIAADAGVQLYAEDEVKTERVDNFLDDGSVGPKVSVDRAKPVQVVLAGKIYNFRTQKNKVGEVLKEHNLEVQPKDVTNIALDSEIEKGQRIIINRLSQNVVNETKAVEAGSRVEYDSNQDAGYKSIKQAGRDGKKIVTYLVDLTNGVETGRRVMDEKIIEQPVEQIVVRGTKKPVAITQAGDDKWAKLRFCESGGNYANKRNPIYRGAYQFDYATWSNYGGYRDPADAPAAVQDAKAQETFARRGASPWPVCGRYLR